LPALGRGKPADRIGAERVERDVAEVEKARVPHDDVEPERKHHVDGNHDRDVELDPEEVEGEKADPR
jgi:hypothetical protein